MPGQRSQPSSLPGRAGSVRVIRTLCPCAFFVEIDPTGRPTHASPSRALSGNLRSLSGQSERESPSALKGTQQRKLPSGSVHRHAGAPACRGWHTPVTPPSCFAVQVQPLLTGGPVPARPEGVTASDGDAGRAPALPCARAGGGAAGVAAEPVDACASGASVAASSGATAGRAASLAPIVESRCPATTPTPAITAMAIGTMSATPKITRASSLDAGVGVGATAGSGLVESMVRGIAPGALDPRGAGIDPCAAERALPYGAGRAGAGGDDACAVGGDDDPANGAVCDVKTRSVEASVEGLVDAMITDGATAVGARGGAPS